MNRSSPLLSASILAATLVALLTQTGCVVQRGRDFGHWAQSGEPVKQIHFIESPDRSKYDSIRTLAMFPLMANMAQPYLDNLNKNLLEEAQNYFDVPIVPVDRNGKVAEFVTLENLMPMDGTLNTSEAGRVGQLLGVSHVLCAYVREHRLHPPQLVVLDMTLVDSLSYKPVLKMTAQYDASEQNVLLALDKYLRNRSARHYTQSSLDIILRSPAEYAAFVSAECMRTFSQKVWPSQKTLKGSGFSSDSKTKKDE